MHKLQQTDAQTGFWVGSISLIACFAPQLKHAPPNLSLTPPPPFLPPCPCPCCCPCLGQPSLSGLHDCTCRPTGLRCCRDNAIALVTSHIPNLNLDGKIQALKAAVDHIVTRGAFTHATLVPMGAHHCSACLGYLLAAHTFKKISGSHNGFCFCISLAPRQIMSTSQQIRCTLCVHGVHCCVTCDVLCRRNNCL